MKIGGEKGDYEDGDFEKQLIRWNFDLGIIMEFMLNFPYCFWVMMSDLKII